MDIAQRTALLSRARRLQVGAIVVKDDRVISIGFNGMPAGWDNNCENKIYPNELMGDYEQHYDEFDAMFPLKDDDGKPYHLKSKPEVLHAERNAIDKLAKGSEGGEGASIFITHAPCLECAKSIYGAGIKQVFYNIDYRSEEGMHFLKKCGVSIEKIITENKHQKEDNELN